MAWSSSFRGAKASNWVNYWNICRSSLASSLLKYTRLPEQREKSRLRHSRTAQRFSLGKWSRRKGTCPLYLSTEFFSMHFFGHHFTNEFLCYYTPANHFHLNKSASLTLKENGWLPMNYQQAWVRIQHLRKSQVRWCVFITPAPRGQRQADPGCSPGHPDYLIHQAAHPVWGPVSKAKVTSQWSRQPVLTCSLHINAWENVSTLRHAWTQVHATQMQKEVDR